jgi:hypothetical protein
MLGGSPLSHKVFFISGLICFYICNADRYRKI